MNPQEQAAARARFDALFNDFFATSRREDLPQLPAHHSPERTDADLYRDLFA